MAHGALLTPFFQKKSAKSLQLQNIHDILLCIHPSSARKHHHFFEQKVLNYLIIFIFFKNNFMEK